MSSYPKCLYHATKEPVIVPDEAAHKALGAEWKESPAEFEPAPKAEQRPSKKVK